jgi:hypothetical protein
MEKMRRRRKSIRLLCIMVMEQMNWISWWKLKSERSREELIFGGINGGVKKAAVLLWRRTI